MDSGFSVYFLCSSGLLAGLCGAIRASGSGPVVAGVGVGPKLDGGGPADGE